MNQSTTLQDQQHDRAAAACPAAVAWCNDHHDLDNGDVQMCCRSVTAGGFVVRVGEGGMDERPGVLTIFLDKAGSANELSPGSWQVSC